MLRRQDEANRTLYVGNLDYNVKEEILYELFLQAGPLSKVTIAKDKDGNCKSFGFVSFQHTESVPYAIALLNGIRLFGRPIKLQYQIGSSLSSESDSVFQGPESSFASPLDYGMPLSGGTYELSHPSSPVHGSFLSQAYVYFQGWMSQFLSLQNPGHGWTAPEQQRYEHIFPWYNQTSMHSYPGPQASCSSGPSPSSWESEMARDCRMNQSEAGPRNPKRNMESSDSDCAETSLREHKSSNRRRKLKVKKKNLLYCSRS